jgi:membrane AbrB-like protein
VRLPFLKRVDRRAVRQLALTLTVAAVGGLTLYAIGAPAPWLSGSALAVASASIAGARLAIPPWLRDATLVFLGATMASAISPETVTQMADWLVSLTGLALCVFATMAAASTYLERVHGYDRATARLASVPGALPYVLALATQSDGDQRRIAIIQMIRLAALLVCLPSLISLLQPVAVASAAPVRPVRPGELAILMLGGALGAWVFKRLGAPAASLFGAMIAGALLYGSGAISSSLPEWLMIPGFVVIGAMVGSNFSGLDHWLLLDTLLASIGSVLIGAVVAVLFALPVAWLVGLPAPQLLLAYTPGGVETMAILALAFGLDPAFVGGHHLLRFFGLSLVVPLWLRGYLRRGGRR